MAALVSYGLESSQAQSLGRLQAQELTTSEGHSICAVTLPSLHGGVRSTAEFAGKPMVLHVFASW